MVTCEGNAHCVRAGRACINPGCVYAREKVGVAVARCMNAERVDVSPS